MTVDTLLEHIKTENKNNQILQNFPFTMEIFIKNISYFLKYI